MSVPDDFTLRSDSECLRAYASSGAEEPFNELIRRYGPLAYGTAFRSLGDPANAEDAAQAAFLALMRKAKTLSAGMSVAGWLQRAAFMAARDIRKMQRRRASYERDAAAKRFKVLACQNSDSRLDDARENLRGAIDAALAALPAAQRDALVLRFLAGKSRAQVAEALACSESTVQTRINRARIRLREILERKQIVPSVAFAAWKLAIAPAAQPVGAVSAVGDGIVAGIRNACFGPLVSSAAQQASRGVLRRLLWESATVRIACGLAVAALGLCGALMFRAAPQKPVVVTTHTAVMSTPATPAATPLNISPVSNAPIVAAKISTKDEVDGDFEIGLRPMLTGDAVQTVIAKPPPKAPEAPPVDLVLNIRESRAPLNPNPLGDAPELKKKNVRIIRTQTEEMLTAELTRNSDTGATRFSIGTISIKNMNSSASHRP